MEGSPEGGGDGQNHSPQSSPTKTGVIKGKSCKGCLYYSSVLKANGRHPRCFGISKTLPQALLDKKTSHCTRVPAHIHGKKDGVIRSPLQPHKPAHSTVDDFYTRFTRNAGSVASGVAKNLNKVGIKNTVDEMMHPYHRPPKWK